MVHQYYPDYDEMSDKMKIDVINKMFSGKDEIFEKRRMIRE